MHLIVEDVRSLDAAEIAEDLGQSPAGHRLPVVFRFRSRGLRACVSGTMWRCADVAARQSQPSQASLVRRSLCRDGDRACPARHCPAARRPRLLALWHRRTRLDRARQGHQSRHRARRPARRRPSRRCLHSGRLGSPADLGLVPARRPRTTWPPSPASRQVLPATPGAM